MLRVCGLSAWVGCAGLASGLGCGGDPSPPILPTAAMLPSESTDSESGGLDDTGRGTTAEDDAALEEPEVVSPRVWMVRASIDLRGIRPSLEELQRIEEDPEALDGMVDEFLRDPRTPRRLAWVYDDTLHSAVWFQGSPFRYFPDMTAEQGLAAGWAPLALVETVIREDRPWSDILTSPTLMQNDPSAGFWQRPAPGTGDTWTPWSASDGRPMSGLLTSDALWLTIDGDRNNFNHRRANATARMFVCADMLERDLTFTLDLDASSLTAMETAIRTEPGCQTCHAALDPLAAFFGGFVERSVPQQPPELGVYDVWDEEWYRTWMAPAWFGRPGYDLVDLGQLITADPRFSTCTGRRFAEGLIGAPVEDLHTLSLWAAAFDASDQSVRVLVGEIVRSSAYGVSTERVMRPTQLATVVADLLRWSPTDQEDLSLLAESADHRLLGGGTDDVQVLQANPSPGVGHHLLQTWIARRAVPRAVESDLARERADRALFTRVDPTSEPLESELRDQLAEWHERFLSIAVESDGPEVDRLLALYGAASDAGGARMGFETVLSALLRHPRALVY